MSDSEDGILNEDSVCDIPIIVTCSSHAHSAFLQACADILNKNPNYSPDKVGGSVLGVIEGAIREYLEELEENDKYGDDLIDSEYEESEDEESEDE